MKTRELVGNAFSCGDSGHSPGRLFFPAEYRICITSDHSLYTCI